MLEFKSRGAQIFGELTAEIAGSPTDAIAIFLDDEELIAPVVETVITAGSAFIQGRDFTVQRVSDLALLLESGRLPVPIELIQERTVGASLGDESLAKSLVAGLVGLLLESGGNLSTWNTVTPPAATAEIWPRLLALLAQLGGNERSDQSVSNELHLVRKFYGPLLEDRYDHATSRSRDLEQLEQLAELLSLQVHLH